jgi:hypothetical protein
LKLTAVAAALAMLAGCATSTDVDRGASADDGLSGTQDQFDKMTSPCIAQASRRTGLGQAAISVTDRIRTGGGPLLTLNAGGTKYSCRLEDDGSVTVFSEFAN